MGQETKEPYITAFRNCFWMTALLFAKYVPLIQNTDLLEMVSQKARRTQDCLARQSYRREESIILADGHWWGWNEPG